MEDGRIRLRSYRLAFELERRIHRIDSFRIPLPYGLPLAALGWAGATLVLVLMAAPVPVIGPALALAPMPVRLLFLPGLVAHVLCRVTDDGRPVHEALGARLAYVVRPKHRLGLTPVRPAGIDRAPIPIVPDERGDAYRAGTVSGPAELALRLPARLLIDGQLARLTPCEPRPLLVSQRVRLREGQRLVVA